MALDFLKVSPHPSPGTGRLSVIPEPPFATRNQFLLSGMNGEVRGDHAHRKAIQMIWCMHGSCTLVAQSKSVQSNGRGSRHIVSCMPEYAIVVPPMTWIQLCKFSTDCEVLVWSSEPYDESEYIRDPKEYEMLTGCKTEGVRAIGERVILFPR